MKNETKMSRILCKFDCSIFLKAILYFSIICDTMSLVLFLYLIIALVIFVFAVMVNGYIYETVFYCYSLEFVNGLFSGYLYKGWNTKIWQLKTFLIYSIFLGLFFCFQIISRPLRHSSNSIKVFFIRRRNIKSKIQSSYVIKSFI